MKPTSITRGDACHSVSTLLITPVTPIIPYLPPFILFIPSQSSTVKPINQGDAYHSLSPKPFTWGDAFPFTPLITPATPIIAYHFLYPSYSITINQGPV